MTFTEARAIVDPLLEDWCAANAEKLDGIELKVAVHWRPYDKYRPFLLWAKGFEWNTVLELTAREVECMTPEGFDLCAQHVIRELKRNADQL